MLALRLRDIIPPLGRTPDCAYLPKRGEEKITNQLNTARKNSRARWNRRAVAFGGLSLSKRLSQRQRNRQTGKAPATAPVRKHFRYPSSSSRNGRTSSRKIFPNARFLPPPVTLPGEKEADRDGNQDCQLLGGSAQRISMDGKRQPAEEARRHARTHACTRAGTRTSEQAASRLLQDERWAN